MDFDLDAVPMAGMCVAGASLEVLLAAASAAAHVASAELLGPDLAARRVRDAVAAAALEAARPLPCWRPPRDNGCMATLPDTMHPEKRRWEQRRKAYLRPLRT